MQQQTLFMDRWLSIVELIENIELKVKIFIKEREREREGHWLPMCIGLKT